LMKNEIIEELFEELYENDDDNFKTLVESYSGSRDDEKLKDMILRLYSFSMSGPWPERWLNEKAEEFNISTVTELDKTEWINVLRSNLGVELNGFINMMSKAIEIIKETDGLEPYLETFTTELSYLDNAYASLSGGLEEMYNAFKLISFGRIPVVRKNKVSDENAQATVKGIRDSIKKKLAKLIEDSFTFTPEEAVEGIKRVYPCMKTLANITLEFGERFNQKKRDKNLLDFNDLEHLCLK
ncbi:helicase-exonuclease AddAB subunit AddA, partial [Clostridium saudiense]|nr:helicase-exonuclease AddAB subunit AddA [Clostridium saudiense]